MIHDTLCHQLRAKHMLHSTFDSASLIESSFQLTEDTSERPPPFRSEAKFGAFVDSVRLLITICPTENLIMAWLAVFDSQWFQSVYQPPLLTGGVDWIRVIGADVAAELRHTLVDQQSLVGDCLKKVMPLVDGKLEPLLLRDPIHSRHLEAATFLLEDAQKMDAERKLLAIAQCSGAGKTKLAFSVGMCRTQLPFLFPVFIRLTKRRQLHDSVDRYIVQVLNRAESMIEASVKAKPFDEQYAAYEQLTILSKRVCELYVLSRVSMVAKMAVVLANEKVDDVLIAEALVRCQFHDKWNQACDQLLCQSTDSTIFTDQRAWDRLQSTTFAVANSPNHQLYIIYDEVTQLLMHCQGFFLHNQLRGVNASREEQVTIRNWEKRHRTIPHGSPYVGITSLFYMFRSMVFDLLDLKVPQLMADTHFSVWQTVLSTSSPTRLGIRKMHDLHRINAADMYSFLEQHFHIGDRAVLLEVLRPLEGRPLFFFADFLPTLWQTLKARHAANRSIGPSAFDAVVRTSVDSSLELSRDRAATMIQHTLRAVTAPFIPGNYMSSKEALMLQACVEARLRGGKYHCAVTDVRTLVTAGIAHLPPHAAAQGDSGDITFDLSAEPVLFESLIKALGLPRSPKDDRAFGHLAARVCNVNPAGAEKGTHAEHVLAWSLFRMSSLDVPLSQWPGVVPEVNVPDWLIDVTCRFERGETIDADQGPSLLDRIRTDAGRRVFYPPEAFGPDLLGFGWTPLQNKKNDDEKAGFEPVILSFQCKAQRNADFAQALLSTNPGFFCLTNRKSLPFEGFSPRNHVAAFFTQNRRLNQRVIRIVFSVNGFVPHVIRAISRYNVAHESTPIVLMQSSDLFFGSVLHEALRARCKLPSATSGISALNRYFKGLLLDTTL